MPYLGHSLGGGSYIYAEMQLAYSTASADKAVSNYKSSRYPTAKNWIIK